MLHQFSKLDNALLVELLGNKHQIKNVDHPIAIEVWRGFTKTVGNLHQIQDVNFPIAVDVNDTSRYQVLQG